MKAKRIVIATSWALLSIGVAAGDRIRSQDGGAADRDFFREDPVTPLVFGKHGTESVTVEVHGGPLSPLATLIDIPGDTAYLPDLSLLLSGRRSLTGDGRLVLARPDAFSSYFVKDAVTFANANLAGVAVNPANLDIYVLDSVSSEIRVGSYLGGNVLPQSWSVFADSGDVPELAGSQDFLLEFDSGPTGPALLMSHALRPEEFDIYRIPIANPTQTAIAVEGTQREAFFSSFTAVDGQTSVPLQGPSQTQVSVIRMSDGAVIGSGMTNVSGNATVTVSPALVLGEVYGSQSAESSAPPARFVTPTLHWGQPQAFSSGATMLPFDSSLGLIADVGSNIFAVSLEADDPNGVELGSSYPAFFVVGIPSQVVPYAGTYLLGSTTYLTTTLQFLSTGGTGFVNVDLPIPNNPAFGGVQIAFQWWILDGQVIRLSDIVAVVIRSDPFVPPGQEAYFGPPPDADGRSKAQELIPSSSPWSLIALAKLAAHWRATEDPSLLARVKQQLER